MSDNNRWRAMVDTGTVSDRRASRAWPMWMSSSTPRRRQSSGVGHVACSQIFTYASGFHPSMLYCVARTIWSAAVVTGSSLRIASARIDAKFHRWASARTDAHSSFVSNAGSSPTLQEV
jgi:hypothetical protein